jgi:uncharacterized cupin superfamily protein
LVRHDLVVAQRCSGYIRGRRDRLSGVGVAGATVRSRAGSDLVYAQRVSQADVSEAVLDRASGERFQSLRRELGVESFGLNLIALEAGQRGRIHVHEHQEEVYLVLEGELTVVVDGAEHVLGPDRLIRVGPVVRRQLVNAGPRRAVVLALGGAGEHVGRDALAWASWDDEGPGRPPQDVPPPADLPLT